jgi:hypothetical protein
MSTVYRIYICRVPYSYIFLKIGYTNPYLLAMTSFVYVALHLLNFLSIDKQLGDSSYVTWNYSPVLYVATLIKNKIKFSSYIKKTEWSSCKVIYEEGLPNI